MYSEGSGVTADFIRAYSWLSVSKTNGDPDAPKKLDLLIKRMSKEQIAVGQILASELFNEIENRDEESPVHTKFD
jgi:TPR repeat protein